MENFMNFFNGAILLLALGIIYDAFNIHHIKNKIHHDIATGTLVGGLGIAIMLTAWELTPGIVVDTRIILICLAGVFFGRNSTLIAILLMCLVRLYQGGDGLLSGVFVIGAGAAIGLVCRSAFKKNNTNITITHLFGISGLIFIAANLSILLLPADTRLLMLKMIYPVILVILPLSTIVLGTLLNRQQHKRNYFLELIENKKLLARERALLKSLIDSIPDLIFYKSIDGNYLGCNKAFEALTGLNEQQLINKTDYDLFEHEVAKKFRQQDQATIISAQESHYDDCLRYPCGKEILFDTAKTPLYGEDGKIAGLVGTSRDMTLSHKHTVNLRQSEARFRHVFESMSHVAVQGYNRKREVIFWNHASTLLYGYTVQEALGRKIEELIIPASHHQYIIDTMELWFKDDRISTEFEAPVIDANGDEISVYSSLCMTKGINNEHEIYCIDIDLRAQQQAEEHADMLSKALEQSPMSVVITDKKGIIEYVNAEFERTSGHSTDEIIGQPIKSLHSSKFPHYTYSNLISQVTSGKSWQGEMEGKNTNGKPCWEHVHIAPITDVQQQIKHYLAIKYDITQQKEQEQKILYQAHFDNLTGLANRFLSLEKLDLMIVQAKRNQQKVAVIFLDFDDFKKVNDTLGHYQGDQLLIEAAQRLKSAVRESDIVGRLGGDEFIVLIHLDNDISTLNIIAQKILSQFRIPFILSEQEFIATVSIGIAVYPNDSLSADEILQQADCAMYHSKKSGSNTYSFFTQQMNKDITRRVLIEQQLRLALANEELSLNFQPLVSLPTMDVIAAEALLRWHNPTLGHVTPNEFIAVAEQTGLIIDIGMFVINKAIEQVAQWRKSFDPDFYIAINVSPRQCRDQNLVAYILDLLEQYQLPTSAIELEITEGVLIGSNNAVEKTLQQFSDSDIKVAMDDFGTGYSSLSYLRKYTFNTLKIDRSFTHNITSITADLELVSAAILMGHALNLKVVTEGVETNEQLVLLGGLKCDIVQGFYLGKPVTAAQFDQQHFNSSCDLISP